jgi:hypothetical protein
MSLVFTAKRKPDKSHQTCALWSGAFVWGFMVGGGSPFKGLAPDKNNGGFVMSL